MKLRSSVGSDFALRTHRINKLNQIKSNQNNISLVPETIFRSCDGQNVLNDRNSFRDELTEPDVEPFMNSI